MGNKEHNLIIGKRLQEILELRNCSQSELTRLVMKLPDGEKITRMNVHNYINGTSISYKRKILFSKALNINEGYLLGYDGFECDSYNEYLEIKGAEMARANLSAIKKQASFCGDLMDRLIVDIDEDDEPHFSRYKDDIKRIRRELNDLSHKMEWNWQ